MKGFINLVFLAVFLSVCVSGGRIYPWGEPRLTYPNKGQLKTLDLFFSLENPLPAGHVIKLTLPFGGTVSISTSQIWQVTTSRGSTPTTVPTTGVITQSSIFQPSSGTINPIYLRYSAALASNTTYVLRVTFSSSPSDTAGFLGWIQFETSSPALSTASNSASDIAIVYDQNLAFAPLHWLPAPGNPTFTTTTLDVNNGTAAAVYTRQFKFQLTQDFWLWPTIVITWDNPTFAFSNCLNVDTGVSPTTATPLAASQYTCSFASSATAGTATILYNAPIAKSQVLVFSFTITNPTPNTALGANTNVNLLVMHRYNMNLTEITVSPVSLSVSAPGAVPLVAGSCALTDPRILLSWGIDRGQFTNAAHSKIFRIAASTTAQPFFQTQRFQFMLNSTIATGNYIFTVGICTANTGLAAQNCDVLENSIAHNLGSGVQCVWIPAVQSPATNAYIQCTGITTLSPQNKYYIAARVWLLTSAQTINPSSTTFFPNVASIVDTLYGQMTLTQAVGGATVCTATRPDATTYLQASPLSQRPNFQRYGSLVGHTTLAGWTSYVATGAFALAAAVPPITSGIYANTVDSTVYLGFLTANPTTIPYNTPAVNLFNGAANAVATLAGLDIFLNPALFTLNSGFSPSRCSIRTDSATVLASPSTLNSELHCYGSYYAGNGTSYTRLRLLVSATGGVTATGQIGFYWEEFVTTPAYTGASLGAEGGSGDYYAAFYNLNSVTPLPTPASTNVSSANGATDIGELGTMGTSDGITVVTFWSQYIYSPLTQSIPQTGVYSIITNNVLAADGFTSSNAMTFMKFRFNFNSSVLPPGISGNITFLYGQGYQALQPSTATTNTYGQTKCIYWGQTSTCMNARPGRAFTGTVAQNNLNTIERLGILTTPIQVGSLPANTIVTGVVVVPIGATATLSNQFGGRFAIYNPTTGWYWLQNSNGFLLAASAAATALPTIAICTNTSTTQGIRLLTSPSDVANTQVASETLWIASNGAYTAAAATNTFAGIIVWCAGWNWQTATTSIGNSQKYVHNAWNESCSIFDYSYTPTGTTTAQSFWCIYCPLNDTTVPGNDTITINNFKTASAVDVLQPTFYTISKAATAAVFEVGTCSQIQSLYQPGLANAIAVNGTGYGIQGQKATFIITAGSTWSGITRVLLTGRTNSTSSAVFDTNFPYGTYDTSGACFMAPSSQLGLYSNYISCTAAILQGYIQISFTALSTANAAIQTWAFVLYGFNPNSAAGSSSGVPTPNISYFIAQTQTGNSYSIVDQSPIASWTLPNFTNAIYLADVRYERPYLSAKGYFKWDFFFPAQRNMYFNDQLIFSLDAIANNQSNINSGVVRCRITDQYDALLQVFQSCTLNGAIYPATLTLVPWGTTSVYEFSVPKSIRVYLDNVQTIALQAVKTIYGRLIFQGAATVNPGQTISLLRTNTSTDQQLSALVAPNNFATLQTVQHLWKVSQGVEDISFNISLNNDQFTTSSRIAVVFPSYYLTGLTVRSALPYCTIDSIVTYCYIVSPRTLKVEGFNGVRAANTSFILKVQGVSAPAGAYSLENFWVQVNNATNDLPTTLSTAGVMTDVAYTAVTLSPVHVTWHYLVGTSTRSTAAFNWVFTLLNNAIVNATKAFQVIFPDTWSIGVGSSAPSCRVYDYITPTVTYASQLGVTGNQVNLNFSANIPVNASMNLECVNVRTPDSENATYPNQDVIIRVGEANGTLLLYHSAPSVHNVNYSLTFTKNQGQYLDWTFPAGQPTINNVSVITVTRGTFSVPLNAWVSGRTARNFSITANANNFGFYPSPFNLSTGYDNQTALFGCDVSVPVNNYFIQFTLSDSSTYTVPSNLLVQVTNNLVPINVNPPLVNPITTIQPVSGSARTNPVVLDVSANPPYTSITITPTFGNGTQNFTVSPASLTLTAANPRGAFIYSSVAGAPPGAFSAVTYNSSGPNAAAYQPLATQIVQLLADVNNQASVKPSLIIQDDQTSAIRNSTWRLLNFTVIGVDTATVYYAVGIAGSIALDAQGIILTAAQMPVYNATSSNQAQYGIFIQNQIPSKFPLNVNITNLMPGLTYEIRAVASSLTNQNSSVYAYQFMTTANSAVINRYLFNYTAYPTNRQRQTLLCGLAQILQVPNYKVVGVNGDSCGVAPWNAYSNASNQVAVYFYPLNVEFDSATRIPSALSNLTILSQVNTSVSADNNTVVNAITADGTEINQQVTINLPAALAIGQSWFGLYNVSLNTPGFIFYAISNSTLALPLAQNIRNVGTQNGFSYYHPSLGSVSINFTSLNAGVTYTLYVAASNNDPSVFANFTAVSSYQIALQGPTSIMVSSASSMMVSFILAVTLALITLMV